jgi:actin-like ATPase involved in cell morphogenesis
MIVDIGGGTPRCGDLARRDRRLAVDPRRGDELDEAIIEHVKREYKLMIARRPPRR